MKLLVDAVIFDLDGTLIDSAEIYFKLVEKACTRLNLPIPSHKAILEVARSAKADFRNILPASIAHMKDEVLGALIRIMRDGFPEAYKNNAKLIPGVPELLKRLHEERVKIGIVTSTHSRYLDIKLLPLKEAGVVDFIDCILCIEDSTRVKPEPDPLIKCAAMLGVEPSNSVYVGDSYVDIRAGKAAGMKTVGVLTGLDNHETLEKEGADIIIESVESLLTRLVFDSDSFPPL